MSVTIADLKKVFAAALPEEKLAKVDPALSLTGQGVDSLAITAMAVALQNAYGITLTVEEGLKLKTLNDVLAFLNARKG